jgi:hypothetical protein
MLRMNTLLTLESGGRRVRLSYVFEDDYGCRKGLTVRRLLPDPPTASHPNTSPTSQRLGVHTAGGAKVGILDPEHWESEPQHPKDLHDQGPLSVGVLTCVFTISRGVDIGPTFRRADRGRVVDLTNCAGQAAHWDGKRIGTILDQLNHLQLNDQCVYPLLCLERSNSDLVDQTSSIRNGAMVATEKGALIGIIVSIFDGGKFYAVAPIQDLLEWHRLRFLREDVEEPDQGPRPAPRSTPAWNLQPRLNPEFRELVGLNGA